MTQTQTFLLVLALLIAAAVFYASERNDRKKPESLSGLPVPRQSTLPGLSLDPMFARSWIIGPTQPEVVDALPAQGEGNWHFNLRPLLEAHYVTMPCGSLEGKSLVRLRYKLRGKVSPVQVPEAPPLITLFFQQDGDQWVAGYETYRWYAHSTSQVLEEGEHEIWASFDDLWVAVQKYDSLHAREAFKTAMLRAARIGFVLGQAGGLGHGIRSEDATFTVTGFWVV